MNIISHNNSHICIILTRTETITIVIVKAPESFTLVPLLLPVISTTNLLHGALKIMQSNYTEAQTNFGHIFGDDILKLIFLYEKSIFSWSIVLTWCSYYGSSEYH